MEVHEPDPNFSSLRLYIAGQSSRSQRAIENLKRILDNHYPDKNVDLEIVDIYQQKEMAKEANVIGAPTLVRQYPLPLRRLIGDLSNEDRVVLGLDLDEKQGWDEPSK